MALLKNLETLARDVERLASEDTDPLRGAATLNAEVDRWQTVVVDIAGRGRRALESLKRSRDSAAETFEHRLARELREKGHDVYGDATLLIINGTVHVETDLQRTTVQLNDKPVADLSPVAIVAAVAEELERITKMLTPSGALLRQILEAYERELKLTDGAAGSPVHTLALLPHMALARQRPAFIQNPSAANYREYPRELFRADLHGLLRSGSLQLGDRHLRYASGSDTAGAIYMMVPALGRPAHIGRIWFETAS
jgi:hypothetical protein